MNTITPEAVESAQALEVKKNETPADSMNVFLVYFLGIGLLGFHVFRFLFNNLLGITEGTLPIVILSVIQIAFLTIVGFKLLRKKTITWPNKIAAVIAKILVTLMLLVIVYSLAFGFLAAF